MRGCIKNWIPVSSTGMTSS
nr:WPE palindromic element domain-containing protein [Wolbachia endosymbiont of Drosophila ananassae]